MLGILLVLASLAAAGPAEPSSSAEPPAEPDRSAQDAFQKAVAAVESHRSIQARLLEQVQITDQPMRMTGQYQQAGKKTRLELNVRLSPEIKGALLEISDGEVLWTQTEFRETQQVTLRNLKQIAAAIAEQPELASSTGRPELGLGGLSALLQALERTMQFDQRREETEGGQNWIVLQGRWKPEVVAQWTKNPNDELPPYIPDLLRIYLNADTLFPQQFLYLKRQPEKTTYRPIVRLEFQDVQFDQPIDEAVFDYTPPDELLPDDVTQQYIEQLKRRLAPPAGETKAPETTRSK